MKRLLPVLILLPLVMAQDKPQKTESVRELAMKGVTAWETNKDSAAAIAYLQKAIAAIQKAGGGLAACLPKAMKDWTAGKPKDSSYTGGSGAQQFTMITITQSHTRKSDNATARFTITNSPQIMKSMKQMVDMARNPQFAESMKQNGMEVVQDGKWTLVYQTRPNRMEAMAIHESIMAQVRLSGVNDATLLKKLLASFPRAELERRSARTMDAAGK